MKNKFYYGNDSIQKKQSFKVQDIRKVKSMAKLDILPIQQSKTQNQISDQSFVEEPKTLQRSKTQLFSIARAKSELRSKKLLTHMTHKREQSLESEQTLMLHLGQKEQDEHHKMVKILIDKRLRSRQSQSHLKSEQSQDRKSLYLSKMTLRSDVTRDKKLNEAKFNFSCKFALAIDLVEKIADEKITLEKLLNKEQIWNDKTHKFDNPPSLLERQGAYMKLYTNLINLPSNLKGLEFACKSLKSAQKLLKQGVSQTLENYLYENYEQGKLKQMTFKSQLFYILMIFSDLYQRQDEKYVKVNCDQPQNNIDSLNKIEKLYMQSADKSQIVIETEISLKYSHELLLKQSRQVYDYSIVLDINMIKQIYCFCNKVQELLEQKIVTVSQQPDYYDRNFDFLEAYKQIKCQNIIKNPNDAFSRPRLFQSVLSNQIKLFEQRYGQLDKVSNMQRQQAILADLKIEQVYHKIALPQYHSLLQRMIGSKQEYILKRMDEMDRYSKAMFLQNLERIDFEMIDSLLYNCSQKEQTYFSANIQFINGKDQSKGLQMIKNREVGLFLMAGGRSTRYPDKPICKPGSPSRKAPIQLIFERLRKIIQLSQEEDTFNYKGLPIGIMISDANGMKIKEFIREKKQFGFDSIDYLYQKTLPVLDCDKKILFNVKDEPVLTPNGTGYVFPLLIQFMRKHPSIKYIHVLGCENLLALPLDPYLLEQDADIICKVVDSHLYCDDKIYYQDGLFKYLDESLDLSMTENTEKITKMCLNDLMISVDFLERLSLDKQKQFKLAQKYHIIKRGNQIQFERHVFDVFEVTDNLLLLKSNENALILDDAKKAVIQLSNHHKQWVGLPNLNEEDLCEVCPNMSYNGEGLKQYQGKVDYPLII